MPPALSCLSLPAAHPSQRQWLGLSCNKEQRQKKNPHFKTALAGKEVGEQPWGCWCSGGAQGKVLPCLISVKLLHVNGHSSGWSSWNHE